MDGHSPVTSHKMKQMLQSLASERLGKTPKPFNNLIRGFVTGIHCIGLEINDIYLLLASYDHIQLVGFENGEQVLRDYFVQSVFKIGN